MRYAWRTAIGLQVVDGLEVSEYLLCIAARNIEGESSPEKADALLQTYHAEHPSHDRTEEADRVSVRIVALLLDRAFNFTPNEYLSIHKKLLADLYPPAGYLREYNITNENGCWMERRTPFLLNARDQPSICTCGTSDRKT